MDVENADIGDILARHPVPRRRLSVAEFYRLTEIGVLLEGDRVELLEGQLVQMSAIGPRHALAVDALNEILVPAVTGRARVRVQNPVTLDEGSEPQPDFAVVTRQWPGYPKAHPAPADIYLLIEVADSSFNTDSGAKRVIYAKAGVREFWIVDLIDNVVRVHRQPSGYDYLSVTNVMPSEPLAIEGLPGVKFAAQDIFT
jgi:Uma2 family endonuclease